MKNIGGKRKNRRVRAPYTLQQVRDSLIRQRSTPDKYGEKPSWRTIAKKYGVTHAACYRLAIYGQEPKDPKIRLAFGMSKYVMVEALECGHAPIKSKCQICNPDKYKKTFEQNCEEYDEWLRDPKTQAKLQDMMQWAESKENATEER